MTDEEKAEKYANKRLNKLVYCSCCQNPDVKQAYLDGLAEGRNSYLGCETPMNKNYMFMYSVLLKENEQLKAQIEKMENCWNCKFFKEKKYQACKDYKKNNTRCCAFYKWELAE